MKYRQAQRVARAADQALGLTQQVTLDSLQASICNQRHRKIVIEELSVLPGTDICGIWLVLPDKDVILHAPTRSSWHRQQIILHEFSHMILHHDIGATDGSISSDLLPELHPGRAQKILRRDSFNNEVELTAELLADRLAARIMRGAGQDQREHLCFGEVFG